MARGKTITAFVKLAGQLDPSFEKTFNRAAKEMSGLQKTASSMKNLGNGVANVGKSLTRNVTVPIVGAGAAAVKLTADFDASMSEVKAISGATGEEFDALRAKAQEMGRVTKFTASESAEAMKYMAMAGWDAQQTISGLPGVLNLAAASGEDLGTVSDIVTDALTAFKLKAEDAGHFSDVLAKASSSANTDVGKMGETFKYVANNAGSLGYSIEDTSFAIGLLGDTSIKSGQAGTTLRQAFINMSAPTASAKKWLDKLNISMFDAQGNALPLKDVLDQCRTSFKGLSEEQQQQAASAIFGSRAMSGMLGIINRSQNEYDKLYDKISASDGAAEKMAKTMQDNLSGQLTILKSQLQDIAIQFGDALMPSIRNLATHAQNFAKKLGGMSDETKALIIKIAAVAASIGPLLLIGGKLLVFGGKIIETVTMLKSLGLAAKVTKFGGSVMKLGGLFGKLGTKVLGLGKFLIGLGPTFWIVAGVIAAVIAVGVLLYKNWDTIKAKATQLKEWVVTKWQELKTRTSEFFSQIPAIMSAKLEQAKAWAIAKLNAIKNFFSTILSVIVKLVIIRFVIIPNIIREKLAGAASAARGALQNVKQVFVNKLTEIANWVAQKLAQIRNAFAHPITATINIAKNIKEKVTDAKAKGGFTHGVAIAGEDPRYPVEAVLSFNPKYRDENIAYWARAGRMLGATPADMANTNSVAYDRSLPNSNEAYTAKVGRALSGASTQPVTISSPSTSSRNTINMGGISFSPTIKVDGNGEKISPEKIVKALRDYEPEFIDFVMKALAGREEGAYATDSAGLY